MVVNFKPPVDLIFNPAFTPVTADFKAAHFDARRSIYAWSFFAKQQVTEKRMYIYWYLLTHGIHGIREIQKDLNIPSPSSVSFQINKLMKAGIVAQNKENGKYYVKEEIKTGIMGFYIRIGSRMIPRFAFYLTIYLLGLIVFLVMGFLYGDQFILNPINLCFLFYLIFGTIVFIFESIKIRNMIPKRRKAIVPPNDHQLKKD